MLHTTYMKIHLFKVWHNLHLGVAGNNTGDSKVRLIEQFTNTDLFEHHRQCIGSS